MCGVVVAVNTGIGEGFLDRWFYSWIFAFPVALIAAFTMAPISTAVPETSPSP